MTSRPGKHSTGAAGKRTGHTPPTPVWRFLPLAVLILAMAAAYAGGVQDYLSLASIAEHRDMLKDLVERNFALSVATYMLVYIAAVALSLPGAAFLSILGGFLFGWMVSVPATVIAATLGAIIVFEAIDTAFGAAIAARAGPFIKRLRRGFSRDAFNYLLFLRLVPLFPFFAVNAVAGLMHIRLSTFVLATIIGIIPASFIFAYLGSGLDSLIDERIRVWRACVAQAGPQPCKLEFDPASLLTPEIVIALVLLALMSLVPIVARRLRRSGRNAEKMP